MNLFSFKEKLGEMLIYVGKDVYSTSAKKKKRGRPSSSPAPQPLPIFKKKRVDKTRSIEKQHDLYDHFPEHDGKPNSLFCKRPGCHLMSNWMCENWCIFVYYKTQ